MKITKITYHLIYKELLLGRCKFLNKNGERYLLFKDSSKHYAPQPEQFQIDDFYLTYGIFKKA